MNWIFRWFGIGMVLCLGLLFWWYPSPAVFVLETPDWAASYEGQFSPSRSLLVSQTVFHETMRQTRSFVPLHDYILNQLAQQGLVELTPEQWHELTAGPYMEKSSFSGVVGYAEVDALALSSVVDDRGYLVLRDGTGIHSLRYRFLPAIDYGRHELPPSLQFPYRAQAPWVAGVMVLGVVALNGIPVDKRFARSTLATPTAVLAGILAISISMIGWPFLYGVYGSDAGFASMLVGLLLFLTSVIGLGILGRQMTMLRRLFAGEGVLTQWVFSPDQWQEYGEQRSQDSRAAQMLLWIMVSGIALLIIGVFAYHDGPEPLLVPLAVVVSVSIAWRILLQWNWHRRDLADQGEPGEVIIGYDGLYAAGEVHCWRGVGSRLRSAEVVVRPTQGVSVDGTVSAEDFVLMYSVLSAYSMGGRGIPWFFWHDVSLSLPIPPELVQEVRQAAGQLQERYHL